MKHTIESLKKSNGRFLGTHYRLTEADVDLANKYTNLIEKSRSKLIPKAGDIVRYTNEYGDYSHFAHIDNIVEEEAYICASANPSIHTSNNNDGFSFSTSGGPWYYIPTNKMEYVGTEEKEFWDFGHCGACADGGIYFKATVNVWECNENKMKYSTKERDKYYIYHHEEKTDCGYHYTAHRNSMSAHAWRTENDLQAWLRTFRADIEQGYNCFIAWAYKEIQHHVSPDEFEKIDGIEDTMLCNGARMCKRIYDDENSTVHTYFVWYWEDPTMGDFYKQAAKQNEIRKQYELGWSGKENSYATNELLNGTVSPIEISKYFVEV